MCWPPPIAATVMALWVDVGDDVGWTQASVSSTADRSADAMTAGPELRGQRVVLRLVIAEHVPDLRRILGTPEVRCAGVMRPRPRSGPLTTCPPPGSPSCSTDRSAEWCSTARRRSRRTGTRRSTSFSIRLSTGRVSAATPFSPWSATSCASLTDPRDDRYRGDAPTLASWGSAGPRCGTSALHLAVWE
jgi:hypothetical protein